MAAKAHETEFYKAQQKIDSYLQKDESEADAAQAAVSTKIKSDLSAIY